MSAEEVKAAEEKKTFKLNVSAPEFKFNAGASDFVPKQAEQPSGYTNSYVPNRYSGGGYQNKPQNYYPPQQYGGGYYNNQQQPQQQQQPYPRRPYKPHHQNAAPAQQPQFTKPQPSTPSLAAVVAASLGPTPAEAAAGNTSAPSEAIAQVVAAVAPVVTPKSSDVPDMKTVVVKGSALKKESDPERSPTRTKKIPPVAISAEESELVRKRFEELDKVPTEVPVEVKKVSPSVAAVVSGKSESVQHSIEKVAEAPSIQQQPEPIIATKPEEPVVEVTKVEEQSKKVEPVKEQVVEKSDAKVVDQAKSEEKPVEEENEVISETKEAVPEEPVTPPVAAPVSLEYSVKYLLGLRLKCQDDPSCDISLEIFLKNEMKESRGKGGRKSSKAKSKLDSSSLFEGEWRKTVVEILPSEHGFKITVAEGRDKVVRQAKSLLNKLTPEKFEKILLQVVELTQNNLDCLDGIVAQVFEKGVNETHFAQMYAAFSRKLCNSLIRQGDSEQGDLITSKSTEEDIKLAENFRRCLIMKCQEEFESEESNDEKLNALQTSEEKEEFLSKMRRRENGLITFIGQLYNMKLLNEGAMKKCIYMCLKAASQKTKPIPEDIELVSKLLTTIGCEFEKVVEANYVNELFRMLEKFSNDSEAYPSRIRFMLKDLIDLRNDGWKPRRAVSSAKTLTEIRNEVNEAPKVEAKPQVPLVPKPVVEVLSRPAPSESYKSSSAPKSTLAAVVSGIEPKPEASEVVQDQNLVPSASEEIKSDSSKGKPSKSDRSKKSSSKVRKDGARDHGDRDYKEKPERDHREKPEHEREKKKSSKNSKQSKKSGTSGESSESNWTTVGKEAKKKSSSSTSSHAPSSKVSFQANSSDKKISANEESDQQTAPPSQNSFAYLEERDEENVSSSGGE